MDVLDVCAKHTIFVGNRVQSQGAPSEGRKITRECDHSAKGPFFRTSGRPNVVHVRAHTHMGATWTLRQILQCRLISRFRCGCHGLHVDTGRFGKDSGHRSREDRVCLVCMSGSVEDEHLFLFDCPACAYSHIQRVIGYKKYIRWSQKTSMDSQWCLIHPAAHIRSA